LKRKEKKGGAENTWGVEKKKGEIGDTLFLAFFFFISRKKRKRKGEKGFITRFGRKKERRGRGKEKKKGSASQKAPASDSISNIYPH